MSISQGEQGKGEGWGGRGKLNIKLGYMEQYFLYFITMGKLQIVQVH